MKRLVLLLPLLSLFTFANPSGRRWSLSTCTTTCSSSNVQCVAGRCLPEVRLASSVANTGGMVINGPSAVPYSVALTSMRAGFETWTTPNVTTCSTSLNFAFQGHFSGPSGTAAVNGNDGNNNVIWLGGTSWRYGSGTLGLNTTTFSSGLLLDADIEFNNNSRWGTTGASGDTDLQSVVTHEAGHFIGIAHTTVGNAVMNPSIGSGVLKRTLYAPDLADVCGIYPGTAGGQGSPCTTAAMCLGGNVCEGGVGSSSLLCTRDCTGTEACPTGYSCQPSTAGFACLPQLGVPDQCRFCTGGADCSSGVCVSGSGGLNYCSQSCTVGMTGQCAVGSSCVAGPSGSFCQPATTCTNQCTVATAAADCAPGYACQGGTCTPTGALGDRCEVSGFCQPCSACVVDENDPNISFCRGCCNGASPLCAGCTAITCAPVGGSPAACLPFDGGAELLCFPSMGGGSCQACSTASPCAAGTPCVGGLCRSSCNPANPGTCPACLTQGASGICACTPAEVAGPNERCAPSGPLAICRTGLKCMSGFCRETCSLGVPGSCPAGFSCIDLAGQTVCIPAFDAGPMGGGAGGGGGGGAATGGGGSGGGGAAELCGPGTCGGCCSLGQCVQPTDEACGTFGGVCQACGENKKCELGACVPAPKQGCSCSEVEGLTALGLALATIVRGRRRRVVC